ncbi:hypothetical protein SAMN03097699_1148 [Flavobacteriaceae bacterium MAR_2010_188]|nr:hypothetical protein SAMN03097699_1148 [Flavobacteriaceae bacterium MAR_2010_188]
MQKLKDAHLYIDDLLPISGKLVDRYNECLKKLGFEETKLKKFNIDGLGWSPEIAEEKKKLHYLNNGDANQHGILITPLQKGKPIYNPFHSFDREMMKYVFRIHGEKINEITRDSAICLDFDQGIDAFYDPLDLLKYDKVEICFHLINDMDKLQKEQLTLIEEFNSGNNFIDENIHKKLLDSATRYGDLRSRNFEMHSLQYNSDSFYTKAFGGVYVLRDFVTPILIFEDNASHKLAIQDTIQEVLIYHIYQPELIDKLKDHLIIECHLEEVVDTERYDRIKKFMFYKVLDNPGHSIREILEDKVLFKSYLNRIELASLKKVNGVEIYLERLERSNQFKIEDMIDRDFYNALHYPHSSLKAFHQDLIWQLLVNISPLDVLHLYWYDKESFYKEFKSWDESFKDWAIDIIRNKI